MASIFKKILKGVLIGAGTVLSLVPRVGPAVGGAILGLASNVASGSNTIDAVSDSAQKVVSAVNVSKTQTTAANASVTTDSIFTWIRNNIVLVFLGLIAFFMIFKPKLKRR